MKKSIAILMVMALVAVAASAQISIGGWGRTMFVPVANSGIEHADGDVVSNGKIVPSWDWGGQDGIGAAGGRIGITIAGNSDNVGFQIDMNGDGGTINGGDEQKVWVKPMSMVKIAAGRAQDDTLRGNAAFGSFAWYRAYGAGTGEDVTFSRLSTGLGKNRLSNNLQGVIITATPVTNLFVAVALRDMNGKANVADMGVLGTTLSDKILQKAQYAVGYTIDGIGMFRAQYLSTYDATAAVEDSQGEFEAAFKVTAVENLYADIGFKMNTNKDIDAQETKTVAAYANYKVAGATVHGLGVVNLYKDNDMHMEIGVGADYGLEGGIGLSADVRYYNGYETFKDSGVDIDPRTAFFAGVTKGFSNGLIGAGVEVCNQVEMGYAIPVRFEYWF